MSDTLNFKDTTLMQSPPLLEGQVHLWWVSLSIDEQQKVKFAAELNEHQQQKMQRLQGDDKKKFYIAGRGYLNRLLRHYIGSKNGNRVGNNEHDNVSISLRFGQHGKPALQHNPHDLKFNFTDTGGYGLFAFALKSELGIDIENKERQGQFDRIVQRRFAPEEQYLCDLTMVDFLRCWTRKEAYGKAIGRGLNYPLREHVLCPDLSEQECLLEQEGFYGQQFSIENEDQNYIACLFSKGKEAKKLNAFQLIDEN